MTMKRCADAMQTVNTVRADIAKTNFPNRGHHKVGDSSLRFPSVDNESVMLVNFTTNLSGRKAESATYMFW